MELLWKSQISDFIQLYSIITNDGIIEHLFQQKLIDTHIPWQISFHPNGSKKIVRFKGGLPNITNDKCTHFEYYSNGNISCLAYFNIDEELHRVDGPAKVTYYYNNNVSAKEYYINGKLHRDDGPARVTYNENGNMIYESYYIEGLLHRENGPACIIYRGNGTHLRDLYYENGKIRNMNGYANI